MNKEERILRVCVRARVCKDSSSREQSWLNDSNDINKLIFPVSN